MWMINRFWSKVDKTLNSGGWVWTGRLNHNGYGHCRGGNKIKRVHRLAWEMKQGLIPKGLYVLHTCDNPACVRLSHLFLGTQKDNILDASNKRRLFVGENNSSSKLTEEQVKQIRKDTRFHKVIASEYGVCRNTISRIKHRNSWRHVK